MAAPRNRPYRHRGVLIPFEQADAANQWSSDDDIQADGFLYINVIQYRVYVVQSVRTGDLYINKVLPADLFEDVSRRNRGPEQLAEELRISTAPAAERRLPGPLMVQGVMRTYFNEVSLWQNIGGGTYSLYLPYCNGGDLNKFYHEYMHELRPIPEHFIWHVFLTLIEAVRFLQRGALPGTDNEVEGWIPIHHRDLALNNIFIHYPDRNDSEFEPRRGFESNAFPEIVLGDFGHGAIEGDDPIRIRGGRFNEFEQTGDWQDVYSIFSVVKTLCLAHISWRDYDSMGAPETMPCDSINEWLDESERPYSDDLLNTLKLWEYEDAENNLVNDTFMDEARGREVSYWELLPGLDTMVARVMPLARQKLEAYRGPAGNVPPDWYRRLDVSWTKPKRLMPYEWWPLPSDFVDKTLPTPPPPPPPPPASKPDDGEDGNGDDSGGPSDGDDGGDDATEEVDNDDENGGPSNGGAGTGPAGNVDSPGNVRKTWRAVNRDSGNLLIPGGDASNGQAENGEASAENGEASAASGEASAANASAREDEDVDDRTSR
ncbi:hypothetical protein O1611_g9747 [Lasiodiplodia mahajangana]|uniref:Uncharacterized protein n=1 Tax=Lasiodiplodia mahajangana TaxID=1108764 RepID=A0ACC2J5Q1_9PEZI|nr:hypothetical protein O1611_g9747 [Lasiodiplodia mahajangana]